MILRKDNNMLSQRIEKTFDPIFTEDIGFVAAFSKECQGRVKVYSLGVLEEIESIDISYVANIKQDEEESAEPKTPAA
jgi:hypothetical protein